MADEATLATGTGTARAARWPAPIVDPASAPALDDPACAPWLAEQLCEHGAVLFRSFGVESASRFAAAVSSLSGETHEFIEESSPRTRLQEGVFTSTDYPPDYPIQFHTEHSYAEEWPMRLFFGCPCPAESGGQTPLSDTRAVVDLLSVETLDGFLEKGVLCERIFGPRRGVSWTTAFATGDRHSVEAICTERGIDFEWLDAETLRTRKVCDAVLLHPVTGDPVWFNHALIFNVNGIEPDWLRAVFVRQDANRRASNTYYGDGTELPAEVVDEIRQAYGKASWVFDWEPGDLLVIDNMLVAHGRAPFKGDRKVLVAMSGPMRRSDVEPAMAVR